MTKNKMIINAVRSENKMLREYAIKYFKQEKIDRLEVINIMLEHVKKGKDIFDILYYIREIKAKALNEIALETISSNYFYNKGIDGNVDMLIANARVELLKKRKDIRPKQGLAKRIMKERFRYYEMDFDTIWNQLWNMDDTHEEFENDYRILTVLSEREDFDYEKFHNEIHIDAIPGYEEIKKINLCYLAGMLKDEEMIGYLMHQVYHGGDSLSEIASRELIEIGGESLIALIEKNYEKAPGNIKVSLIYILDGVKLKSSEELLIKIYEREEDELLKTQLVFALLNHLSKKAIPLLLEGLKKDPFYKTHYMEGLIVLHKLYDIENEKLNEWERLVQENNEKSNAMQFKKIEKETFVSTDKKVGRNDPCPCGSGKKYKKCCINK